ncbi:hypothetical protein GGX14DRAFT_392570 [Mycena pura]|uniref:Uncharacterized protein n=1 Tax=Mycena pura TaxID=153505 RepID=A0AAD6VN73_9AGAR|nr:hypothetical protein GGX14DRAFT_392570 [Mycena pura]
MSGIKCVNQFPYGDGRGTPLPADRWYAGGDRELASAVVSNSFEAVARAGGSSDSSGQWQRSTKWWHHTLLVELYQDNGGAEAPTPTGQATNSKRKIMLARYTAAETSTHGDQWHLCAEINGRVVRSSTSRQKSQGYQSDAIVRPGRKMPQAYLSFDGVAAWPEGLVPSTPAPTEPRESRAAGGQWSMWHRAGARTYDWVMRRLLHAAVLADGGGVANDERTRGRVTGGMGGALHSARRPRVFAGDARKGGTARGGASDKY